MVGHVGGFQPVIFGSTSETDIAAVTSASRLSGHWLRGNQDSHMGAWIPKAEFHPPSRSFRYKPECPWIWESRWIWFIWRSKFLMRKWLCGFPLGTSCNFSRVSASDLPYRWMHRDREGKKRRKGTFKSEYVKYTAMCKIASGNLWYSTGSSARCSVLT